MFIIVEGIDGSGKSTLVKELEQHGAIFLPGEDRYSKKSIKHFLSMIKQLHNHKDVYLCDRSFLSDLVYRYIDDKSPAVYTLDNLYQFCKYCDAIIYCNSAHSFENSIARGENNITDILTSERLRIYYNFLIDIFKRYDLVKVFEYDYDIMNVNDVVNFIKNKGGRIWNTIIS